MGEVLGEETLNDWMTQGEDDTDPAGGEEPASDEVLGVEDAQAAGLDLGDDVLDIFETEELEDEALASLASTLQELSAASLLEMSRDVAAKLEKNRPAVVPEASD
jgi:hypothetical protein